ncbi:hypothetical protein niasHT_028027 [Heterodera trifolii]|uniref:Uncharacterized protein n=1 Tax=Heterodera trifolii TaxID=157864 RepID=A0ABD2KEG0_9BILA
MVILRQESLFLFNRVKGKFVPCWAILSFVLPFGPSLSLYSDGTTKKILLEKVHLAEIAEGIRFGTTSWTLAETDDAISALISHGTEDCLDKALLIAIPTPIGANDALQKKQRGTKAPGNGKSIWFCALTVAQMFEFIQILSDSLISLQVHAPPSNSSDSSAADALHQYKPRPFRATNAWEMFWNNPPPFLPQQMKLNGTTEKGGPNEAEDGTQRRQKRATGWMSGEKSKRKGTKRTEEAEKRGKEEAEKRGKEEAEKRGKEEAEKRGKEEAEKRGKEEAEKRGKEEAEKRKKDKDLRQ